MSMKISVAHDFIHFHFYYICVCLLLTTRFTTAGKYITSHVLLYCCIIIVHLYTGIQLK